MNDDLLDYHRMVEESLRGVVRQSLTVVSENGLQGEHHFYLTFRTDVEGVDIPSFLVEDYPEEMTIVLQHQYSNLVVEEDLFRVDLSFKGIPQTLTIPFEAITTFADPSENFALQFQPIPTDELEDEDWEDETAADAEAADTDKEEDENKTADIVTLDAFRKK